MQKIKIAKIEVKEGDNDKGHWKNFILTGEDKAKVSIFEPNDAGLKPSELKEGDTIEAEIKLKGKYANLTSFTVVEHSEIAKPQPVPQPKSESTSAPYLAELDGRFRNTALMQACAFLAKDEHSTDKDVLTLADKFYAWLKGGKSPEKLVDKESVQSKAEQPALPTTESQTGRPTGMPDTIKTGTDLARFAGKRGVSMADFNRVVQCSPVEIKTEAQLIAAWNVLSPLFKEVK